MSQLEEHFTSLWHQQDTIIFTISEIFLSDCFRVAISQVNPLATIRRNLRSEGHVGPAFLNTIFEFSDSSDMG